MLLNQIKQSICLCDSHKQFSKWTQQPLQVDNFVLLLIHVGLLMQELPSAPYSSALPKILIESDVGLLLRVHAAQLEMFANYEEAMQGAVSSGSVVNCAPKQLKKHQCVLQTADAYKILTVIWKESDFVTSEALTDAGLCRQYRDCDLTAHRLAADLADTAHDVAKLNSRVRNIAIAGATYNLLDRDLIHSTRVILKGTHQLHKLMSGLSEKNIPILKFALFPPVIPAAAASR